MTKIRLLYALFVSYVAATVLHIAFILAHEPFSFDAWNVAVDTEAKPFTIGRFFAYWRYEYTHSNPRIGQALTYLTYKLQYAGEIAMALSYLAITLAVTVIGLGRWPWRRARDLAMWAIVIGFGWFAFPEIGRNMFCRAYGANYVFGAAVQLCFLMPLRLRQLDDTASVGKCIAYALFGVVAGMCNEHTGPALIAFFAGYAWWLHRAGERPKLVWAGGIGSAIGFAAIFFAPGQGERYNGLAQRASMSMRVIQRGISGNFDIFRDYLIYAAPVLGLIVLVLIAAMSRPATDEQTAARRGALRLIALAIVAGTVLAVTMFVSPKLGSRFYLVSAALLLAGFIALLDAVFVRPQYLAMFVALAVCSSAYAASRTIPLFSKVAVEGEARMEALDATVPGSIYIADAFDQVEESWWYIGDDFRDYLKRELVTKYYALGHVFFRGYDAKSPLGLLGIKVVAHYQTASGVSGDDLAFDLGVTRGFDIAGVHQSVKTAVELLRARLAPDPLASYEMLLDFVGAWPPMPRHRVLTARWVSGVFEGYVATIVRKTRAATRDVELPKTLVGRPFEIYVVRIGDEPRHLGTTDGKPLQYVPWRTGVYWNLACDTKECWVIAASRHGG